MKRIIIGFVLLLQVLGVRAQGIEFETGAWREVVEKAKQLNRPIFVDVYTSWCGPCRVMAATTFTRPEIGELYNAGFVNVKIDAEKGEGVALAKKYKVTSYPTYLFINPSDETLVGVGKSSMPTSVFADLGHKMLGEFNNTAVNTADMTARYKKGTYDEAFLQAYIRRLKAEKVNVSTVLEKYMQQFAGEQPTDEQLFFIGENFSGGAVLYDFLVKNYAQVDPVMCKTDGLSAANLDRELMKATEGQMTAIMANDKLSAREKEEQLEKCYADLHRFVLDTPKRDKKILAQKTLFYSAIKDTARQLLVRREYILRFVLPDDQVGSINRTRIVVDKNEAAPKTKIDSAFSAQASIGYANMLLRLSKDPQDKDLAMKVYQNAQKLTPATYYYANVMNMQLYNWGDKKKAIRQQQDLVKKMNKSRDTYLAEGMKLLERMQRDESPLSFVSIQNNKAKKN
ncbi:thioredoxin family protein [Sphingobacterium lumbrici]|uniref:thioredoxin family protein n=1 Tax=Sphingobacterium lumbrici TaxID=2559600 RepID=UPI0015E30243|nr:thioredoxin family protein [Sphingobacterium lumbrici]